MDETTEFSSSQFRRWRAEIGGVGWNPEEGYVPYGDHSRYLLPRRFEVSILSERYAGTTIRVEVEVDPQTFAASIREIHFRRDPDGPPLTALTLRVPLQTLLKQAMAAAACTIEQDPKTEELVVRFINAREGLAQEFFSAYRRGARLPKRGVPVTDTHLQKVAEVYRAALKKGDSPTQAVADTFGVSRSTAGRWVGMARDPKRGFLKPSLGTKAGERDNQEGGQ